MLIAALAYSIVAILSGPPSTNACVIRNGRCVWADTPDSSTFSFDTTQVPITSSALERLRVFFELTSDQWTRQDFQALIYSHDVYYPIVFGSGHTYMLPNDNSAPDYAFIADKIPAVGHALTTTGFTGKSLLQLLRSIDCAYATMEYGAYGRALEDTGLVIGKNIAFIQSHKTEFRNFLKWGWPYLWGGQGRGEMASSDTATKEGELPSVGIAHMTVRPRQMATGTRNNEAGVQTLDSLDGYLVYVPVNCVGTHRVPLVVVLGGAGDSPVSVLHINQQFADKYGMIMLLPSAAAAPGQWDVIDGASTGQTHFVHDPHVWPQKVRTFSGVDARNIDAALKQVLRKYAIDPDRIALAGFSNGGSYSLFLGRHNTDIFSRIAPLSGVYPLGGSGPQTKTTQYFVSGGTEEDMGQTVVAVSQGLREEGHPVVTVIGLRGHSDNPMDEDYMWSWLRESWATPSTWVWPDARTVADSDPVLTEDALTKMARFWTLFVRERPPVLSEGRLAHEKPVTLFLGQQPISVIKVDMVAMATQYPAVAGDLRTAGLTAEQEERYRSAILRVRLTQIALREAGPMAYGKYTHGPMLRARIARRAVGTISPESVLGRNMSFVEAHEEAFHALANTGIWSMP